MAGDRPEYHFNPVIGAPFSLHWLFRPIQSISPDVRAAKLCHFLRFLNVSLLLFTKI